ncbi:hypothetical protein [Lentzea sp. NBRC 102530]|uniref:hypothetical protein n=1 Tax=Lentzea sp. NBRC 102530 TaxID=3032201 RepID=UPI0024A07AA0|nr:hypothetical protein [Lentzea sp. NBRC 102530]GLY46919.1 hypothetical protein Lesp01_05750 [Lentzea sp. NBRC 102530]
MRRRAFVAAMGLACSALVAPGVATAAEAPCQWVVSKIEVPDGYDARWTFVKGAVSGGEFAGTSRKPGSDKDELVLWTGGKPRVVQETAHLPLLDVKGENSAGTVLLQSQIFGEDRASVFLYSGGHWGSGTLTQLFAPAGYRLTGAVGLNDRGDVLTGAVKTDGGQHVGVLLSPFAVGARIIDSPAGRVHGLDDDGTVLLRPTSPTGGAYWRDGQVTPLDTGGAMVFADAIGGGTAGGMKMFFDPVDQQAVLWDRDGRATDVEDGGTVVAINARGLLVGERNALNGPLSVWQGTKFLAELPIPAGARLDEYDRYVVSDDNQVFAPSPTHGPLRWSCTGV